MALHFYQNIIHTQHVIIIKDKISNMGIIIGYKNKDNLSYLAKEFLKLTKERLCKINE